MGADDFGLADEFELIGTDLSELLSRGAAAARVQIEASARSGRRAVLVLVFRIKSVAADALTYTYTFRMSYVDRSVPGGDEFSRHVSHLWTRYDQSQVIPVVVVFDPQCCRLTTCLLPWVEENERLPLCAYCGSTSEPCAGTPASEPPTCR